MDTGLFFSCRIGTLPQETFDVIEFSLREGLSELFSLSLTLVSKRSDIPLDEQLLQQAELTVKVNGEEQRTIRGIVASAEQGDSGFRRTFYTVVIRPHFWVMTLNQDSRIYHQKSVPAVLKEILQRYQIEANCQLMEKHVVREYITQKRESDYDFFYRLAAEEGISFWSEEHQLFYSDSHLGMTGDVTLTYNPHKHSAVQGDLVVQWRLGAFMRPGETIQKDYTYHNPRYPLQHKSSAGQHKTYSVFDSYGRFQTDTEAKPFTKYRLEQLRHNSKLGHAVTNSIKAMPGKIFTLLEHPIADMNSRWQIVTACQHGTQPQALEEEAQQGATTLTNEITFIPGDIDWRPPYQHKPLADGDEVATVVGPTGEEIYVNEHGCIRIHFHWNRYDQPNENASCWVRVSNQWAGDGFGSVALPRIGQEVLISYINGDIDRPVVSGRLYNADHRSPYPLPEHKTKSVWRTKSHKAEGFNELSFEDDSGKEEIYLHAQRDYKAQVNHDAHWEIKNNHNIKVANNRTVEVTGLHDVSVKGDTRLKTDGSKSEKIAGESHLQVGPAYVIKAGQEVAIDAGSKITFSAGTELTIKAGSSFITLNPGGIFTSPNLNIGSGAPGKGKGLNLKMPGLLAPLKAPSLTQKTTLTKSAPYCEECEKCKNGDCNLPPTPAGALDNSGLVQSLIAGNGFTGDAGITNNLMGNLSDLGLGGMGISELTNSLPDMSELTQTVSQVKGLLNTVKNPQVSIADMLKPQTSGFAGGVNLDLGHNGVMGNSGQPTDMASSIGIASTLQPEATQAVRQTSAEIQHEVTTVQSEAQAIVTNNPLMATPGFTETSQSNLVSNSLLTSGGFAGSNSAQKSPLLFPENQIQQGDMKKKSV